MIAETRLLSYFVAVAEERNFTRAASRLFVSQQAMSAQIRKLEQQLGATLFRRTTREVELTPVGEIFLEDARHVLAAAETAVQRARRAARGELGRLRIGHITSAAYEVLPLLLAALGAPTLDLQVHAREAYNAEVVAGVIEGKLDLGIARDPDASPELENRLILREPLMIVVSQEHPLAAVGPVPMAALGGMTLATWPRDLVGGHYDLLLAALSHAGVDITVDSAILGSGVWGRIASGRYFRFGVASMRSQLPSGVALVPLQPPGLVVGLSLVWRRDTDSPLVRRSVELATRLAADHGWLRSGTRHEWVTNTAYS